MMDDQPTHVAYLTGKGFEGLTPRYEVKIVERRSGSYLPDLDLYTGDVWAHHDETEIHPDLWGYFHAHGLSTFGSDSEVAQMICSHGMIYLQRNDPSEAL